jgi:hypothetical protein
MLIAIVPIVVLIVGALMWALSQNPKVSEAGKFMVFSGIFVLTFHLAGETVRIGGR